MPHVGRRSALLGGVGIGATPGLLAAGWPGRAPGQVRQRLVADPRRPVRRGHHGLGRALGPRVRTGSDGGPAREQRTAAPHAARLLGRRAHRPHRAAAAEGARARPAVRRHDLVHAPTTAPPARPSGSASAPRPIHAAPTSLVWSGDTCGQGFGINAGARRAHDVRRDAPDPPRPVRALRRHDLRRPRDPLDRRRRRAATSGATWSPTASRRSPRRSTSSAAGSATSCRTRTSARCTPTSRRSRSGTTTRPATTGIPASVLDDDRYTERRCDVLAARGRRAWQEYMPVPVSTFVDRGGDGYASGRIYRRVPRGQHLDLFVLDMRSYRGRNDTFHVDSAGHPRAGAGRRGSPSR